MFVYLQRLYFVIVYSRQKQTQNVFVIIYTCFSGQLTAYAYSMAGGGRHDRRMGSKEISIYAFQKDTEKNKNADICFLI